MPLGQVTVNNLNLGQGGIPEIERHFLFIGTTDKTELCNKLTRIDALTDLSNVLGDDAFAKNIVAAQLNAGENWTAAIYGLDGVKTWDEAINHANQTESFEGIVLVDTTTDKNDFLVMQAKAEELKSTLGRWIF